jgi:hypothetical protein
MGLPKSIIDDIRRQDSTPSPSPLCCECVEVSRKTVGMLYNYMLAHFRELESVASQIEDLMEPFGVENLDEQAMKLVCAMVNSMFESTLKMPRSLIHPRIRLSVPSGSVAEPPPDTPTFSFDRWMARTMDSSLWL